MLDVITDLEIAEELIGDLAMQPHPEGGYFTEFYRDKAVVQAAAQYAHFNAGKRNASTSIYYLLKGNDYSAFHRLNSAEIWHFYAGSSLQIYLITPDGQLTVRQLGNKLHNHDAHFQTVLPAQSWFAAELMQPHSFALLGCTVAPGFEYADFELAKKAELIKQYPQHTDLFVKLCKD